MYFTIKEFENRLSLIDPAGDPFLIVGLNHTSDIYITQEENRKTIFENRFGGNLESYLDSVLSDMKNWGFNAFGGLDNIVPPNSLPYLINLQANREFYGFHYDVWWPIDRKTEFPDVFSPGYRTWLDEQVEPICSEASTDPLCIGYTFCDVPLWNRDLARKHRGTDWVSHIRELPPASPGKKRYVEFLKGCYGDDITSWNRCYCGSAEDFDDIASIEDWRLLPETERIRSDDEEFLTVIAAKYYETVCSIIRKHDPNHLLFGDRYNGNFQIPDGVLREAGRHVDAISIQYFGRMESDLTRQLTRIHEATGKPIYLADTGFAVSSPSKLPAIQPEFKTQYDRGMAYKEFIEGAFGLPFVIGFAYCGYIERLNTARGRLRKDGLKDINLQPFSEATELISIANREVYGIAGLKKRAANQI